MSLDDDVALLKDIPLFAGFDGPALKLLAFTSRKLTYADGEDIFRQGDAPDCAYVIVSGHADIVVETGDGPLTIARADANELVGEIAILSDVPRTATVRASGDLVVLQIEKEDFLNMIDTSPRVARAVMRVLATRLHRTTKQLRDARSGG